MSILIDPVTRQRVVYDKYSYDVQYDLISDDTTISKETVPVVGSWEDHTGSAILSSRTQQQFAGVSNELQGTDPSIESHSKLPVLNEVGDNAETTRRRQRRRRVKVVGGKVEVMNSGGTSNQ